MYATVLALHLGATLATFAAIGYTFYVLWTSKESWYRACALAIAGLAAFEVVTGTTLALLSPTLSAAALTLHIALYLGVCAAAEVLLYIRVTKALRTFPIGLVTAPVLTSLCLFALALRSGV